MRMYDITRPLSPGLPVYPGDPAVRVEPVTQIRQGDGVNVSRLTLSSHCGTHIDAPRHFFDDDIAVDGLQLDVLIGPARVIQVDVTTHITASDLAPLQEGDVCRVLLKTTNSGLWHDAHFRTDYLALTESAAQWLVQQGVRLVGIDYLSVDAYECKDFPVHRTLLGAGVVILEGLDLGAVIPGDYELMALPLLLQDGDGAPARAVLRTNLQANL